MDETGIGNAPGAPSEPREDDVAQRHLECLRLGVFGAPAGVHPRRRDELIDLAVERLGMSHTAAQDVYDIAIDERLDPAYAFELVRCGVAVVRHEAPDDDAPVVDTGNPQWLGDTPPPPEAVLERMLRATFRRLRGLIETHGDNDAALAAFVREPDVEEASYPIA